MDWRKLAVATFLCAGLGACVTQHTEETPPPVALPAAPPPGEPAWITTMDAPALRAAFGQPAYVRKDNGSEMWRYDSASCKAFFFFYPGTTGAVVVRHVETLPRGAQMAADENCLAQFRQRPTTPAISAPSS